MDDLIGWLSGIILIALLVFATFLAVSGIVYKPVCIAAGYPKIGWSIDGMYCKSALDAVFLDSLVEER